MLEVVELVEVGLDVVVVELVVELAVELAAEVVAELVAEVVDGLAVLVDAAGVGGVLDDEHAPTLNSATAAATSAPERRTDPSSARP